MRPMVEDTPYQVPADHQAAEVFSPSPPLKAEPSAQTPQYSPAQAETAPPIGIRDPATQRFTAPVTAMQPGQAIAESPVASRLKAQLQEQEQAVNDFAAKVRGLLAVEPAQRNQQALDNAQRDLKSQLNAVFELKLQLEELQVQELQSRLTRLEQQIGRRRALRDKIVERRAAELLDQSGLQWDTSGSPTKTPRPVANGEPGRMTSPLPPKHVKIIRDKAAMLLENLEANNLRPADVLLSLKDFERLDPDLHVQRMQKLLEVTRKLNLSGRISNLECHQIEEACTPQALAQRTHELTQKGFTGVSLTGPHDMRVIFRIHNDDLGTQPTYFVEREALAVKETPLTLYDANSPLAIGGQLDILPIAPNNPEAAAFLEDNLVSFPISEQDVRMAADGVDVTKVVVMKHFTRADDQQDAQIVLETLDSTKLAPGTDLTAEARGVIAILKLSGRFRIARNLIRPTPGGSTPLNPSDDPSADNTATNDLNATPFIAPATTQPDTNPTTPQPASISRPFKLRFKLASDIVQDLRPILLDRPGHEARPSADNQEVLVLAPPAVMNRVETLINVLDQPDPISRGPNFEYPRGSVMEAARSFFYACAIEDDPAAFSKMLSPHVLATLKGDTKSANFEKYLRGEAPDPDWEKSLRGDWPGKKDALRRFVNEWNKYPLKRLTETGLVAIGFGAKHFCSVSFSGAPTEFYEVTIEPDRTRREADQPLYLFNSLPPWWQAEKVTAPLEPLQPNDDTSPASPNEP
ncbi:MAG: hypothetical protein JSS02_07455 [Planctomycetes bacterium]|nr:hypothetical protein [Planctomycetota bacterium]